MTTHSQSLMIAWGFFVLAVIAVVWAVSGLRYAKHAGVNRKWWWSIGIWMTAKAILFGFLYVVWISDFFERWIYAVIIWAVVVAQLNAFIRWVRLDNPSAHPKDD